MPCFFSIVRLRARCSRTSCTLRSSFSSFSAFAVCSLASHLFASKKAVFKTYNQAQLRLCFFLCQAVGKVLTYLCTFRSLSSPSSTCAPCSAFGQRLARDTVPPFAIFNACSAPDYLFVSNTLRALSSSFSALAVCSLASHLFASKKAVFKTYNQAQLRLCFFLCQAVGKVLTYLCTFRSLSSPSSTCAPCSAFGQRLARDNNSATHARLSRFSTLALRPIISLFQTRSAPCPRLSRLLPFVLLQSRIP